MIASLLAMLFAAAALLALAALFQAWTTWGHRFAELQDQLREVERGVPIQATWREPMAQVYRPDFTRKAAPRPFRPAHAGCVAA